VANRKISEGDVTSVNGGIYLESNEKDGAWNDVLGRNKLRA